MAKNVVTLKLDNTDYSFRPYGTCSTVASTAAKTVAIDGFTLCEGATVLVKFDNDNNVDNPSLNVNNTGAKTIKIDKPIKADEVYEFIYDGTNWVYLNNNLTDLKYFKYFTPDNGGRATFTLIAKLDKWKTGTSSNYYLIGTMYGQRGGNMSRTGVYNIVAQAVSYSTSATQKLYVTDYPSQGCVMPYIVAYTKDGVTENYLALRKTGSGDYIYFQGLMGNLLPQNEWIELNVQSGADLPEDMTIVASPGVNQAYITTEKYSDGSNTRTLLHSGNYTNYTVTKTGTGASGTWPISISGNATTATTATNIKQTVTTSNASYPLLLAPSGQSATTNSAATYFDSDVTLNPSTNVLNNAKVYESLIQWGNTGIQNGVTPVDAAMVSEFSQNRLSFLNPDLITIEFTRNNGTDWYTYPKTYTDAGTTDTVTSGYEVITNTQKQSLITDGLSQTLYLGARKGNQTVNDKLRITILGDGVGLYINLKKILFYYSQANGTGNYCLIEAASAATPDTFTTVKQYEVSGWTNWNSIPYDKTLGEWPTSSRAANTRKLRLTFGVTGVVSNASTDIYVNKLRMFSPSSWAGGNSLTTTGHLYTFDVNKHVTFPANMTVKGNTTLGDASTDTVTILGKATINNGLILKGTSSKNPLITRSIQGSDGNGSIGGPLYMQYGINQPILLGNTGAYTISADGSQYSGNAATATQLIGPDAYVGDSEIWHETNLNFAQKRNTAITTTQGSTTANRYYGVELDKNGKAFVNVPWTTTKATTSVLGGFYASAVRPNEIELEETNWDAESQFYGVELDKNGKAFVHVPLSDTQIQEATNTTLGGIKVVGNRPSSITTVGTSAATGRSYGIELDSTGKAFVNVPWTDTPIQEATNTTLGGIKVVGSRPSSIATVGTSAVTGRSYGIELDSTGKAFVNIPWTDTKYTAGTGIYLENFGNYSIKVDYDGKTICPKPKTDKTNPNDFDGPLQLGEDHEWMNTGSDLSNLNNFVEYGIYNIFGEHTRNDDNLPIQNTGGGHTFQGRLLVYDSSLPNTGNAGNDCCITQVLTLSNRVGGDGNTYIRTGVGSTKSTLTWGIWGKHQTNVEVGVVGTLDNEIFINNGMYSGALSTDGTTFVLITVNNYAIAGSQGLNPTCTQLLYGTKLDGTIRLETRTCIKTNNTWQYNEWHGLETDSINIKTKVRPLATGNKLVNNSIHYISSATTIYGFIEPPVNEAYTYTIILNNISPNKVVLPNYIKWADGNKPNSTTAGLYEIVITGINPGSGDIIYTATWAKYK